MIDIKRNTCPELYKYSRYNIQVYIHIFKDFPFIELHYLIVGTTYYLSSII